MTKYRLSILIPARNEYYLDIDLLHETVVNVLANTSAKTQLVVVLDGYTDSWPKQPLPVNDRLTVIHHRQSIGQRAATNEAARVATGEYLMKLDAHCALDEGFDEKLLATFEPHWTVVPKQFNLLAFNWKCKQCGNLHDQGPKPDRCKQCNSRFWKQVKLWIPRDGREGSNGTGGKRNTLTHSWRFDTEFNFQYYGAYTADEKHCSKHGYKFHPEAHRPIHDTMSLLGACWAIRRERYFELDICEEAYGSWGDQGTEIACKTWLSGGELKVNTNTWFAHFFRVGGIGFPYPDGGRKERAKARSKEIWLNNKWPKQVYPLSWLIEKFNPLPDWHSGNNPILAQVQASGLTFSSKVRSVTNIGTNATNSLPVNSSGKQVSVDTAGLASLNYGDSVGVSSSVLPVARNEDDVSGITAGGVVANDVIQYGNTTSQAARDRLNCPGVHEPMSAFAMPAVLEVPVTLPTFTASPDPAVSNRIAGNSREKSSNSSSVQVVDVQDSGHGPIIPRKPSIGYLYYTCNSHDITLELAARNNLARSKNGHELGCVSLQRTDFGDWNIVVDSEKGPLTMHRQILMGLERLRCDYVFFCENDILYHPSHFEFVPPRGDCYYYNVNVWRVRYGDGYAIKTSDCRQLSGLCASRLLLLEHYRKRVQRIAAEGFSRKNGYEPGTRGLPYGYDDHRAESWQSPLPNLDIKDHGQNATRGQWSPDDFRNKKYTEGWQESRGQIGDWPLFYGRLQEWLKELADGS